MNDTQQETGEHKSKRCFGIDAWATVLGIVKLAYLCPQPTQIENSFDAHQDMVVGQQLAQ